ncbi:hypothetical protein AS142_00800 [Bacillus pumilus]|uniref:S8 family peptidase n=1 Tax=Bacillus sp. SIMBA_005 TaxID=3085754 RepID=UPI0007178038|nr:hypothetical protein AS142_00800 [Bacillus pumilus]
MIKRFLIILIVLLIYFKCFELHSKNLNYTSNIHQQIPWSIKLTKKYVENNREGESVRIAIIDSGIDGTHPDLVGKVKKGLNTIGTGGEQEDSLGHGTAVAGIITANDNEIGLVGITQNVELYPVKILDSKGKGSIKNFVKAVQWCIDNKIDVINASFGLMKDDPSVKKIIDKAIQRNIIIVAAVGNKYGRKMDYPAAYENVFSVTAVDKHKKVAEFSSKGNYNFAAPGVDIPVLRPHNNYAIESGTSLASAHITGVVSLILQYRERFNINSEESLNQQIYKILKKWY